MNKRNPLVRVNVIMKNGIETSYGFDTYEQAQSFKDSWKANNHVARVSIIDSRKSHASGGS